VPFENSPGFVPPGLSEHALEGGVANRLTDASPVGGKGGRGDQTWELVMILELHRQGVSVSAIARQLGIDRKTVRTHIAKGLTAPAYTPRPPRARLIDRFVPYLRDRLVAFPALTGRRLWRELKERGYPGGYTAITDLLRDLRPPRTTGFEVRFETPPGEHAQVDFAQFVVEFTDEPGVKRIVWLFSMVLGYSRLIWLAPSFIEICRRCCAVISPRLRRSTGFPAKSSMTA
jgi:transposase